MQSEHESNGRSELDADGDLRVLFRERSPSFIRVDINAVLRDAAVDRHNVVADTHGGAGEVNAKVGGIAGAAHSGLWSQRRILMLARFGVMGVCAASLCIVLSLGMWGGNSVLAQVQDAIGKVSTATYTVTHTAGDQQEITWTVKVLGGGLCRVEQPNGIYLIFDVKGKRIMEVDPHESKVRVTRNVPVPRNFDVISTLSNVKTLAVERQPKLSNREIDGKNATGIVIEENGVRFDVWIDPATHLPLEMQRRGTSNRENASPVAETWSDFRFNEPLDKSLFAFEVPKGFAVDTRQSPGPTKRNSPSYGFGPEGTKTKAL